MKNYRERVSFLFSQAKINRHFVCQLEQTIIIVIIDRGKCIYEVFLIASSFLSIKLPKTLLH